MQAKNNMQMLFVIVNPVRISEYQGVCIFQWSDIHTSMKKCLVLYVNIWVQNSRFDCICITCTCRINMYIVYDTCINYKCVCKYMYTCKCFNIFTCSRTIYIYMCTCTGFHLGGGIRPPLGIWLPKNIFNVNS